MEQWEKYKSLKIFVLLWIYWHTSYNNRLELLIRNFSLSFLTQTFTDYPTLLPTCTLVCRGNLLQRILFLEENEVNNHYPTVSTTSHAYTDRCCSENNL